VDQQIGICAHAVFKSENLFQCSRINQVSWQGLCCISIYFCSSNHQSVSCLPSFLHSPVFVVVHHIAPFILVWLGSRPDLLASTVFALLLPCGNHFTEDQLSTELHCKLDMVLNYCVGLSLKTMQSLPSFFLNNLNSNIFLALISLILQNRRCGDLNPDRLLHFDFGLLSVKSFYLQGLRILSTISQSTPPVTPRVSSTAGT
jgi:hypothetical protein